MYLSPFRRQKTAFLYRLFDEAGNFMKWGISQNPAARYSKAFMDGKKIQIVGQGARKFIAGLERIMVEMGGGPDNKEPWAPKNQ
jgi:hypothetical protein